MYEKGDGLTKNDDQATQWFRRASNAGNAVGQFCLGMHLKRGIGCTRDMRGAWVQLSLAAEQKHANAMYNLAFMYECGQGCKQDCAKARELYSAAADCGHKKARDKFMPTHPMIIHV